MATMSFHLPEMTMSKLTNKLKDLGGDRGAYVYGAVAEPVEKVLDIGCAYGWTLAALTGKAQKLYGIDVNETTLEEAQRSYPHIEFGYQDATTLPYNSNEFDVVILSEVIEHVGDDNKRPVINEAHRVLKENGLFIFTAPYAGIFAWADPMDFKRRFPPIYRLYMRLSGYVPHTSIEVGHKHVSVAEIEQLFDERFDIERIDYSGLFFPLFSWILAVDVRLRVLPRRFHDALNRFRGWESGVTCPRPLAFNVRLTARKKTLR